VISAAKMRATRPSGKTAPRSSSPAKGAMTPKTGKSKRPAKKMERPEVTISALSSVDQINPLVVGAEYAVRGRLLDVANGLERRLQAGDELPFTRIVKCNIGNPQALGQTPITFARQVLSLLMNPALIDEPAVGSLYPADAIERARDYARAVPSVGAYTDSQGIRRVREEVAEFIGARDGYPASADDIFLTDGASAGVKAILQLLIRGPHDGVLCPIPQYPLYSATTAMLNGTLIPYYLDENAAWGVDVDELERSLERASAVGATARAICIINPGNPTGQSLPPAAVDAILTFAAEHHLIVMADEVYQENVYGDAPPFTSFKKALCAMRERGAKGDAIAAERAAAVQLVSYHSTSKGFYGECGLRGGYFELTGVPADVKAQVTKLASVSLCSNVVGQIATGLMVRPPAEGEASFAKYTSERAAILSSLHARAQQIAAALNALPGIECNAAEGALYLFPQLKLPPGAIDAAAIAGMPADEYYCIRLLEATGLVVVPGSGFRQVEGTFHFRTTFLPPEAMLTEVLGRFASFHEHFLSEHGAVPVETIPEVQVTPAEVATVAQADAIAEMESGTAAGSAAKASMEAGGVAGTPVNVE